MCRNAWIVCGLLVTASACAGSVDDTGSTDVGPSATTLSQVTATETDALSVTVDPCDLVTSEQIESATGFAVQVVVAQGPVSCLFDLGDDASVAIFVTVDDGRGRLAGAANIYADYASRAADDSVEHVLDLGTDAYYDTGFRAIAVDAGDGNVFVIGVNGGHGNLAEPQPELVLLARSAIDRL